MAGEVQFYLIKAMAIVTTGILFFIVLTFVSMGISLAFPDDPNESIHRSVLMFLGQLAVFYIAFWGTRVWLKKFPEVFDGKAGFDASRLKEAQGGGVLAGVALLLFGDAFVSRGLRIKEYLKKKIIQ